MGWPKRLRTLFKVFYILICVSGVAIVAYSATYGAYFPEDVTGLEAAGAELTLTEPSGQACVKRFRTLHGALKKHAHTTLDSPSTADAGADWRIWAQEWHRGVKQAVNECRLGRDASMKPLLEVAEDLKRLEVAYATAITGFRQSGHAPRMRLEAAFNQLDAKASP